VLVSVRYATIVAMTDADIARENISRDVYATVALARLNLTKVIQAMSTRQSNGSANQAGDEVDRAPHDRRAKHVGKQSMGEHGTPDPSIAHRGV
jgi:hypothetical protein